MKVTRTEKVTRTYCDVCGDECVGGSSTLGEGENAYTVCLKFNQFHVKLNSGKRQEISCETLARMYIDFPHLANTMFLGRHDGDAE